MRCPGCGHAIIEDPALMGQQVACPQCGVVFLLGSKPAVQMTPTLASARLRRRKSRTPVLMVVLACAALVGFASFVALQVPRGDEEPKPNQGPPIAITAVDLVAVYDTNEVRGDALYKGRRLTVTGAVGSISKDLLGERPFITLKSGHILRSVQCSFKPGADAALASLNPGDEVTVTGRCEGLLGNVFLEDCDHLRTTTTLPQN